MEVAIHADEDVLNQIFRFLAIADSAVDKIQQAFLVTSNNLVERSLVTIQKSLDDFIVAFDVLGCDKGSVRNRCNPGGVSDSSHDVSYWRGNKGQACSYYSPFPEKCKGF